MRQNQLIAYPGIYPAVVCTPVSSYQPARFLISNARFLISTRPFPHIKRHFSISNQRVASSLIELKKKLYFSAVDNSALSGSSQVPWCSLRARGGSSPCSPCSARNRACAWLRAGPVPMPSGIALALRCAPGRIGGVGTKGVPPHRRPRALPRRRRTKG